MGFVVGDLEASLAGYTKSLAATWDGRIYEDPLQRVKVAFLTTRVGEPQIELVEAVGDRSPVLGALRSGGGMHHLCFEVADLSAAMSELRGRGAIIAKRPKPAVAFGGRSIAWMLTSEKMLIELLELHGPAQ